MTNKLCFSICDMNKSNCLIRKNLDRFGEIVTLIDYEVGSYAPRATDLASHFVRWTMEFTEPCWHGSIEYPSEEIRKEYIEEYLKLTTQLVDYKLDVEYDSVDRWLMETLYHGMVHMLMFTPSADDK